MGQNTSVFSSTIGDVVLPVGQVSTSAPDGSVDAPLGGNTPLPAVVTTLHATSTTQLDGAVTGAGFVAAVKTIAGAGQVLSTKQNFLAPLPADLISVVSAVTPTNVALTIAAQPAQARKLQVNMHVGTTTTTAITAGNVALVGVDQDGNAVTENISMICNSTTARKSVHAYATLTSATVSAYAASGSGTGNTVGIGVSNDFGIACGQGTVGAFACIKASKNTRVVVGSGTAVTTWTNTVLDDVASTTTVDVTARTIAPTTAPDAAGNIDFEFTANFSLAA